MELAKLATPGSQNRKDLVTQHIQIHTLENGITLLGEEMPWVSSGALSIWLPLGAATDPAGLEGATTILAEMVQRGAGPYDSRALSDRFERVGAGRSVVAGIEAMSLSSALRGENLPIVVDLFSQILRAPHLPNDELDSVRQLALQELRSLEDEPQSKVMVELAKRFYPYPFGRSQLGTEEGLNAITIDALKAYCSEYVVPSNMIIGVAGKFEWKKIIATVEEAFGSWSGRKEPLHGKPLGTENVVHHIEKDTNQVQIALAYPSVSYEHSDYYTAKVAVGVLSGGMAGRLFIEVREKRGLVYRVSASQSAAKGRAAVFVGAGTTKENAPLCLEVILQELNKLKEGVTDAELKRSKADLKSRVIMQSELSSVRASALVNDWWHIGRVRSLEEIKESIDRVTSDDIVRHVTQFPVRPMTLVTLGPVSVPLRQI
jgi:predicted Zn-dependent peptidase